MKLVILFFGLLTIGGLQAIEYEEVVAAFKSDNIDKICAVMKELNASQQVFYLSLPQHRHVSCEQLKDILKPEVYEVLSKAYEIDEESLTNEDNFIKNSAVSSDKNELKRFSNVWYKYPLQILAGVGALSSVITLAFNEMIVVRKKEQEKQMAEAKQGEQNKKEVDGTNQEK